MPETINDTEIFLIAMAIIFSIPYLIWRVGRTDYYAPLVVVQIITGILLGPGILGKAFPDYYALVFSQPVAQCLNGIAWWSVMIFVWIAGIELNLHQTWEHRRESFISAGLSLGTPLVFGCVAAFGMSLYRGWIGPNAMNWQFILGVGMTCAVTSLPILILFMEKLEILRRPIGQRILRYASLDDLAIWGVLAVILMDWRRIEKQGAFLLVFSISCYVFRKVMRGLPEQDRWYAGLIWLAVCSYGAEWAGLHFMVGAFLAGAVMDTDWFNQTQLDFLRHHVLLIIMPVYFLNTGLKTDWAIGGEAVFIAAFVLMFASVIGKLTATRLAGKILKWEHGETAIIGWLLQTKGLIMIVFADVLLDKGIISGESFTALLLVSIASTMLTVPMVSPKLKRLKVTIFIDR